MNYSIPQFNPWSGVKARTDSGPVCEMLPLAEPPPALFPAPATGGRGEYDHPGAPEENSVSLTDIIVMAFRGGVSS